MNEELQMVERSEGYTDYEVINPERREFTAPLKLERAEDKIDGHYTMSFSSERPVRIWGEDEVLLHEPASTDFSRLNEVGSILRNHDPDKIIGVPTRVWLGPDKRGHLDYRFSSSEEGQKAKREIDEGVLRGVSVGYLVQKYRHFDKDTVFKGRNIPANTWVATHWSALEATATPIPADPSVGLNRTMPRRNIIGGKGMNKIKLIRDWRSHKAGDVVTIEGDDGVKKLTEGDDPYGRVFKDEGAETVLEVDPIVEPPSEARTEVNPTQPDVQAIVAEALRAETERCSKIRKLGEKHSVDVAKFIDNNLTLDQTREHVLNVVTERAHSKPAAGADISIGETGSESTARCMSIAIAQRAGLTLTDEEQKDTGTELGSMTLLEMGRQCLRMKGITPSHNRSDLAGQLLSMHNGQINSRGSEVLNNTTADFPLILANVQNKALLEGAALAETTYERWCGIGTGSDFREMRRVKLSEAGALEEVPENAGYTETKYSEQSESIIIRTFGKVFTATRQMIVNDDVRAFTQIPRTLGTSAMRVPNDLALEVLIGNGIMSDGAALFSAAHNNLLAPGVPVTDLASAQQSLRNITTMLMQTRAMMEATELAKRERRLALRPHLFLLPPTIWGDFSAGLTTTDYGVQGTGSNGNPFRGIAPIVIEPSLEDTTLHANANNTAHYCFTNPGIVPMIEVAFLDGVRTPYFEQELNTGSSADGLIYKVRMDCGSAPVDNVGAVLNPGF